MKNKKKHNWATIGRKKAILDISFIGTLYIIVIGSMYILSPTIEEAKIFIPIYGKVINRGNSVENINFNKTTIQLSPKIYLEKYSLFPTEVVLKQSRDATSLYYITNLDGKTYFTKINFPIISFLSTLKEVRIIGDKIMWRYDLDPVLICIYCLGIIGVVIGTYGIIGGLKCSGEAISLLLMRKRID